MGNQVSFRERLVQEYSRDELLALVKEQDPELAKQVRRIEWVFSNKLGHLTWTNGVPISERPVTVEELALLIDEPFQVDHELTQMGLSVDQQYQLHIANDPVMWARHFLNVSPRSYQIMILRHPSLRKVLRAGRRLGKTVTMAILLLHYSYTHKDGRCLVVAPMKSHVELIYKEVMRMANNGHVADSITRAVTSPQFTIEFSNGSTIRFFTSGMKSAGKADVARGQEAHVIVLDELDYMAAEDLDALYAMLQKTAENQEDKVLVGASTPSGQRQHFFNWCRNPRFKEFWFPSYCNPFWTQETEDELRDQYNDMAYRHEIEADWGEDVEGVYPRKYVDFAFNQLDWRYDPQPISARNNGYLVGVDWDKYGAGVNIVVLEMCQGNYEAAECQDKLRLCYREEIPKSEYTLTEGVNRVIQLNAIFNPKWIYVDRGYGETQLELLKRYGIDHPETGLKKKVKGVAFSETLEMPDPVTKIMTKKEIKPFMVDNLRSLLEKQMLICPTRDEELYLQLISYVVAHTSVYGRETFEAGGNAVDHAHDALMLACLAYAQNYSDMMKLRLARKSFAVSNEAFLPTFDIDDAADAETAQSVWGTISNAPVKIRRPMTAKKANFSRPLRRKTF